MNTVTNEYFYFAGNDNTYRCMIADYRAAIDRQYSYTLFVTVGNQEYSGFISFYGNEKDGYTVNASNLPHAANRDIINEIYDSRYINGGEIAEEMDRCIKEFKINNTISETVEEIRHNYPNISDNYPNLLWSLAAAVYEKTGGGIDPDNEDEFISFVDGFMAAKNQK